MYFKKKINFITVFSTFWVFILNYEQYPLSDLTVTVYKTIKSWTWHCSEDDRWLDKLGPGAWEDKGGRRSLIGWLRHPSSWWLAVRRCPRFPRCVWCGPRRSTGTAGKTSLLSSSRPLYTVSKSWVYLLLVTWKLWKYRKLCIMNHLEQTRLNFMIMIEVSRW